MLTYERYQALRAINIRVPGEPGNEAIANHIAPQACQVEFELLEDMQQQNTSWIRHQVVRIVFKEIVQIAEKLCS